MHTASARPTIRIVRENPVLSGAFLWALIVAFAYKSVPMMGVMLGAGLVLVLTNVAILGAATTRERNAAGLMALFLTVLLPVSTLRTDTAIIYYASTLITMGAAFVLTRRLDVYTVASRYTLIGAQLITLGYLAVNGLANFPLERMLPNSSTNGVTSYLIILQANYSIVNFLMTRRSSLVTTILTLLICVAGYGRGSLVAATGILAIALAARVWGGGVRRALWVAAALAAAVLVVVLMYGAEIMLFLEANTKIGAGLYDVHRFGILSEYLAKLDPLTLWIGGNYKGTSIITEYFGNPHNSFVRAHYFFGLPYLFLLFFLPIYLIHRAHAFGVKIFAGAVWMIVIFRSFTEPVLFPTLFDFYFFACLFALSADPFDPGRRGHVSGISR